MVAAAMIAGYLVTNVVPLLVGTLTTAAAAQTPAWTATLGLGLFVPRLVQFAYANYDALRGNGNNNRGGGLGAVVVGGGVGVTALPYAGLLVFLAIRFPLTTVFALFMSAAVAFQPSTAALPALVRTVSERVLGPAFEAIWRFIFKHKRLTNAREVAFERK